MWSLSHIDNLYYNIYPIIEVILIIMQHVRFIYYKKTVQYTPLRKGITG